MCVCQDYLIDLMDMIDNRTLCASNLKWGCDKGYAEACLVATRAFQVTFERSPRTTILAVDFVGLAVNDSVFSVSEFLLCGAFIGCLGKQMNWKYDTIERAAINRRIPVQRVPHQATSLPRLVWTFSLPNNISA